VLAVRRRPRQRITTVRAFEVAAALLELPRKWARTLCVPAGARHVQLAVLLADNRTECSGRQPERRRISKRSLASGWPGVTVALKRTFRLRTLVRSVTRAFTASLTSADDPSVRLSPAQITRKSVVLPNPVNG